MLTGVGRERVGIIQTDQCSNVVARECVGAGQCPREKVLTRVGREHVGATQKDHCPKVLASRGADAVPVAAPGWAVNAKGSLAVRVGDVLGEGATSIEVPSVHGSSRCCSPVVAPGRAHGASEAVALSFADTLDEDVACADSGEFAESARRVSFAARAVQQICPLTQAQSLDPDVETATRWEASLSDAEVIPWREQAVFELLRRAADLGRQAPEAWAAGESVNGAFAEHCCAQSAYENPSCLEHLRSGARLVGHLRPSGRRKPCERKASVECTDVRAELRSRNEALVSSLRDDEFSNSLLELTVADVDKGRMDGLTQIEHVDIGRLLLARRLAAKQGDKIRPCDDESANGMNAACYPSEKLALDGVDAAASAFQLFRSVSSEAPALLKADVDSAYRRIPIAKEDLDLAWVAFSCQGRPAP